MLEMARASLRHVNGKTGCGASLATFIGLGKARYPGIFGIETAGSGEFVSVTIMNRGRRWKGGWDADVRARVVGERKRVGHGRRRQEKG